MNIPVYFTSGEIKQLAIVVGGPGVTEVSLLVENVKSFEVNGSIESNLAVSLLTKLTNAMGILKKDNVKSAINKINSFINEISAQSGKKISEESASSLIYNAEQIVSELSGLKKSTNTEHSIPSVYSLMQNFPNPFNPETTIQYKIPKAGHVTLEIYNSLGQKIRTLVQKMQSPGAYSVAWKGKNDAGLQVSSGMYFYRIKAGTFTDMKKMILLK